MTALSLQAVRIRANVSALPLFAWADTRASLIRRARGSKPAPKHCRDCGRPINRSSRGRCKACAHIGLKRECPGDFLAVLRRFGSQGAAQHYRASLATITRWRRELKLEPQARMKRGIGQSRPDRGFTPRPMVQNRDMSLAGQAADYLRRFGSVYRCDETGSPKPKGTHWRRNYAVLSDEQLIARAEKLGWKREFM